MNFALLSGSPVFSILALAAIVLLCAIILAPENRDQRNRRPSRHWRRNCRLP